MSLRPVTWLLTGLLLGVASSVGAAIAGSATLAAPGNGAVSMMPLASGLRSPTNLAFAPGDRILFTEQQTGRVRELRDGRLVRAPVASFDVVPGSETGLLGLALDPDFERQPWVYVYLSDAGDQRNRVIRFRADDPSTRQTVFEGLPTAGGYHNGGELAFGPDGMLYVATGEAHIPPLAQDPSSIGGKILRLAPDGSIPRDNPFGPDSPVYALGIRNSFGLCFDPRTGDLWETENGPDRDDEVNRILPGENYGWPTQLGVGGDRRFTEPQLVFPQIIVPTGCAFTADGGELYFGDYSAGGLHRASLAVASDRITGERVVATAPGGITDVALGPDRALYVATADSILRVDVGARLTPSPSATATDPDASTPGASPSDPSSGNSLRTAIVIALFLVIAGSLYVRARAGRRLRRSAGPPD